MGFYMIYTIPPLDYLRRKRRFSYAIEVYGKLSNPNLTRTPLPTEGFEVASLTKELRRKDGSVFTLAIYQQFDTQTDSEREYQEIMDSAIEKRLREHGINEFFPKDLILIGYDPEGHKHQAHSQKDRQAQEERTSELEKLALKAGIPLEEIKRVSNMELTREQVHAIQTDFLQEDDILHRIALHPIDALPNFYSKEVFTLPYLNRELMDDEATTTNVSLLPEARTLCATTGPQTLETYGFTRQEAVEFTWIKQMLNLHKTRTN